MELFETVSVIYIVLFWFGSNIENFCIRKIHYENYVYKQLLYLPEFQSRSHSMRSLIESKFNIQVRLAHREPLKGVLFAFKFDFHINCPLIYLPYNA